MNAINKITTFVKSLVRDTRGNEDITSTGHIFGKAFAVVTASVVVAGAAYAATSAQNANMANEAKAQTNISGVANGAVANQGGSISAPYGGVQGGAGH